MLNRGGLFTSVALLAALGLYSIAAAEEPPALSVSIAAPLRHGQRPIELGVPGSHFYVVPRNISAKPVNLWRETNSWGYDALSFEVADGEGRTGVVKKKARNWRKNFADFYTLEPNDVCVFEVTFDQIVWENPPLPDPGASAKISMRAVFQLGESDESKAHAVWTGKVLSEKKEYTFYR